jgi:hypothetical protein
VVAWVLVGLMVLAVAALAIVGKQQRALPLTYVRPRTDRRERP